MASTPRQIRLVLTVFALAILTSCAEWPDPVIPNAGGNTDWPDLVPIGPILAQGAAPIAVAAPPSDRIAALNARAARLRGRAIIDPGTRARMQAGVSAAARAALN